MNNTGSNHPNKTAAPPVLDPDYPFDAKATYRLVDVMDHERRSKVHTRELYQSRVGCIATNIQAVERFGEKPYKILYMQFIQSPDGDWIFKQLGTSVFLGAIETAGCLEVYTENSIYLLEPVPAPDPGYLNEAGLIELFLSADTNSKFCRGVYYDDAGTPHDLVCSVHLGMFQDSCLIDMFDNPGAFVCRYFPHRECVEFYSTLYRFQTSPHRMLIHNLGSRPLGVGFERKEPAAII